MTLRINSYRKAEMSLPADARGIKLILLWWFMPIYTLLPVPFLNGTLIAFIRYLTFVILFMGMIVCGKNEVKPIFIIFAFCYLAFTTVNIMIVPYRFYAAVEGLTPFITFLTPVFYFSQTNVGGFEQIMRRIYLWSMFHLLFLLYLFYFWAYIDYGDFATLTACTTVPLYIGAFHYNIHRRTGAVCFLLSFATMVIFGSRAPAIAVMVMILTHQLLLKKKTAKTCALILILAAVVTVAAFNLESILLRLNQLLLSCGIQSRTIMKFSSDLGSKTLGEMLQSSNRGMLWELASGEIIRYCGLPRGFGRIRYLTSGEFYFSHNLFLDMMVYFGFFSIFIIGAFLVRLKKVKLILDRRNFTAILLLSVYFFLCSMTGANILGDQFAILIWSCVFFSQTRRNALNIVRSTDNERMVSNVTLTWG